MVEYHAAKVSPKAVQKHAEDLYRGGYFCCEAVMAAIRSDFEVNVPEEVIAMASGMAVGAGRSGCMCGALNGGILRSACSSAGRSRTGRRIRRLTTVWH